MTAGVFKGIAFLWAILTIAAPVWAAPQGNRYTDLYDRMATNYFSLSSEEQFSHISDMIDGIQGRWVQMTSGGLDVRPHFAKFCASESWVVHTIRQTSPFSFEMSNAAFTFDSKYIDHYQVHYNFVDGLRFSRSVDMKSLMNTLYPPNDPHQANDILVHLRFQQDTGNVLVFRPTPNTLALVASRGTDIFLRCP